MWSLVIEEVVRDSSWSSAKKRRAGSRLKAQAVIAGSLGPRLAGWYRRRLVSCDPVQLFKDTEEEFNAGSAAKNDILIKAAMFAQTLAKRERVDTYIDAIMQLQEDLVTLGHPLEDAELARLLLTNALEVFRNLSTELVGARMKVREFEVGQIRGRLLASEQEENMRHSNMSRSGGKATGSQGGQSTTNAVLQFSTGGNDGHGYYQHQGRESQSRRRSVKEAMQRRPCAK
ncbi:gag-polypeptide of LTR copia-type [Phytophthora infestans]|uniref:Gag-polypeptide of LTR copia-type n=1 Tax=Phytophthora infestans TaxID=4787 RepID=A0A833WYW6_PHYIN|nr:gag-polypeptide of LTR copia-type [Phytophthora infestans]